MAGNKKFLSRGISIRLFHESVGRFPDTHRLPKENVKRIILEL